MISRFRVNKGRSFLKFFISFFLTSSILLGTSSVVFADDGDLDPDFGVGGIVSEPFYNANADISEMALQSDGKIVTCGDSMHDENVDIHLVRFNTDGSLDPSFGEDGMVMTDVDNLTNNCDALFIQDDGKILVAGSSYHPHSDTRTLLTMVRYTTDGTLDSSFGTGGIVQTAINDLFFDIFSVIVRHNKIIVGVAFNMADNMILVQFNDDGSIDNTFGINGIVDPNLNNFYYLNEMIVQSDEKILVVGTIENNSQLDMGLIRFNRDGSLDTGFGMGGIASYERSGTEYGNDLVIQNDGRIVAVGDAYNGSDWDFEIVRFLPSGELDPAFGVGGLVLSDFNALSDFANAVALQGDGKILVVGSSGNNLARDVSLARFTSEGFLDVNFGVDGKVLYDFEDGYGQASSVILDGNHIIVGGSWSDYWEWSIDKTTEAVLIRFTSEGAQETSFGTDGRVIFHGIADVQIHDVILQSDSKILVAGHTSGAMFDDIYLARYESDGSPDLTFGEDGVVVMSFSPSDDQASALALQNDGKILVLGFSYNMDKQNYEMIIVRYTNTGQIDLSFGDEGKTFFDDLGYSWFMKDIVFDSNGMIIVAGQQYGGGYSDIGVVRFTQDGIFDKSVVINEPNPGLLSGESFVIDADDNLFIVGHYREKYYDDADVALVRLNSDLELDPSFGPSGSGIVITDLNGWNDCGQAMMLQNETKLIVAGYTENENGTDFVLLRYDLSGILDTSFGTSGYVVTSVGSGNDQASDVAFSSDGRIVVTGQGNDGGHDEIAMVRYYPNGTIDSTFGINGVVTTAIGQGGAGEAFALQEDNNFVVAGYRTDGLHNSMVLVRYTQVDYKFSYYLPMLKR